MSRIPAAHESEFTQPLPINLIHKALLNLTPHNCNLTAILTTSYTGMKSQQGHFEEEHFEEEHFVEEHFEEEYEVEEPKAKKSKLAGAS